ncbi:flagellar hook-basal body protein [Exiguobacterium flavidum]|uniref:flagellar hook-basal body protein n=1 Tax=Exiguobacterium flavidum TaxID=2184695 RepID=UPI000DF81684|nr:flagellar hook-basal body protein [Exiguobacterium flavidum]
MLRGMYTAAGAMQALQRQQEMFSNNLANVRTPGYRADSASLRTFPEMLISQTAVNERTGARMKSTVGTIATGVYLQSATPNFALGSVTETGNKTDLQLMSDGGVPLFMVRHGDPLTGELEEEVTYSTNGQFNVGIDGLLRTSEGDLVLGEDGQTLNVGSEDFTVRGDGQVTDADGEVVGQLGIRVTNLPETLERLGGSRFGATEETEFSDVNEVNVRQGFLELGNVSVEETMAHMNAALRQFEANQKVIQAYDRTAEKAVTEVGRLR